MNLNSHTKNTRSVSAVLPKGDTDKPLFGTAFYSMEAKEIWKDVVGFEGLYMVSNLGNVKSLNRVVLINRADGIRYKNKKEKNLKVNINSYGYGAVTLFDLNKRHKTFLVHRLVAQAFIPNPENRS